MPRAATKAIFLEPVEAILREGMTPADEIMLRYERDWGRRTEPLFTDYAF
jgi:gamma-glutamylcysteine synthetase